ncbi:hypothetical protein D3C72_215520 [compost metagenome]
MVWSASVSSGLWAYVSLGKGDGTFYPAQGGQLHTGSFGADPNLYSKLMGDFNGDGLTDLAWSATAVSGVWMYVALGKGDGTFYPAQGGQLHSGSFGSDSNLYAKLPADFNGDGVTDMVWSATNSAGVWTYVSINGSIVSDRLSRIVNGSEIKRTIMYKPLTDKAAYTKDTAGTASSYPKLDIQAPMYVVSSVSASNGAGGTVTTNYKYGGLKAELGTGRGMLGFRWLEATQAETGIVTRTEFKQDWPYTGLVSKTQKSLAGAGNNGVLSQVDNTYGCTDFVSSTGCTTGVGKRYYVYASQSTESSWDVNGAALPTIITASQYDIWGNATQVSVSSSDGYSKVTTNSFSNDVGNWYLGRLNKASVTSTVP